MTFTDPMHKKLTGKKLAVVGVVGIAAIGCFSLTFSPHGRSSYATFVGYTNGTFGPHAMFLIDGTASWDLRGVLYRKGENWETWIPISNALALSFQQTNQTDRWWGPQPFEFTLRKDGSDVIATVSIPDTNAHCRVIFDVQEPCSLLSELVRKFRVLLTQRGVEQRFHLRMTATRAYCVTNETNLSANR